MKLSSTFRRKPRGVPSRERGYILLTLMLLCSLILIGLAAVLPQITQQLKRDREEEMIHRGVQYSRAIRKFYKKTGRYPVRLEELDNTNNLRFLRKRYKDPVTGEDFKLLHFGEVKMFPGAGIAGALPPGVPAGALAAATGGVNAQAGGANSAQAQARKRCSRHRFKIKWSRRRP